MLVRLLHSQGAILNRQTKVIRTYINLARGAEYFPFGSYTVEQCRTDSTAVLELDDSVPEYCDPVFYAGRIGEEVCKARGISWEKYYEYGVIEKPSKIANAVYASILRRLFGSVADVKGFAATGHLQLPPGQGVFVPMKKDGEIVELKFYTLSRMLKGK